jgi:hypothetical protein
MRIAVCTLVIGLAGATRVWALPQCPEAREVTLYGSVVGTIYGGSVDSHPVTMYPCEELWIDVAASESDPYHNFNIYVSAYNASSTQLMYSNWVVNTSIFVPNALPLPSGGFPRPGTRDPRSLVTRIDVSSDWNTASYPVSYTLTLHFRPRPGYNRGGLSYQDAFGPLANGTVLHASMLFLETNYYRVSLLPNGTLTLSGWLVNKNWSFGVGISVWIYNMAQQQQTRILYQSVPSNSTHDPNGVTVTFTSSTFTNTSATVTDFYVVHLEWSRRNAGGLSY